MTIDQLKASTEWHVNFDTCLTKSSLYRGTDGMLELNHFNTPQLVWCLCVAAKQLYDEKHYVVDWSRQLVITVKTLPLCTANPLLPSTVTKHQEYFDKIDWSKCLEDFRSSKLDLDTQNFVLDYDGKLYDISDV